MINILIPVLTHSIFCVLNFMLPASRPNFAEVFRKTQNVVQAWFRVCRWRINWEMKNEMERRGWKDVWSNWSYWSGMCLKWLSKAKKLTQNKHWFRFEPRPMENGVIFTWLQLHFIDPFTAVSVTVSLLHFLHSLIFPLFSVSFLIVKCFLRHLFHSPSFEFVLFLLLRYLVLLFHLYCFFLFS